jgi:hypothetical protein
MSAPEFKVVEPHLRAPGGYAHLVMDHAEQTLCNLPAEHFREAVGEPPSEGNVLLCWDCQANADPKSSLSAQA